jgi:hypothetical protein
MKRKWQIIIGLALALVMSLGIAAPAMAQDEGEEAVGVSTFDGALAIIAPWTVPAGKEFTVRAFLREDQEPFPGANIWLIGKNSIAAVKEELNLREDPAQAGLEADYDSILSRHGTHLGQTGPDGRLGCSIGQGGRYILVAAKSGYLPGFTHIFVRDTVNALGIKAPNRAKVNEPVTMTVFERITHHPVEGALVFAITRDNAETWKQEVQALREDTTIPTADKDYEPLCQAHGLYIGTTDENGNLEYAFEEAGIYMLVAVKKGYFPGFTAIAIVNVPKALGIKADPPRALAGEEVTVNVFDRQTKDPVAGADIYALSRENAKLLKEAVKSLRGDKSTAATDIDYGAVVAGLGTHLGETDENGQLIATFDTAGIYLLVAIEPGYIPGFTLLPVKEKPEPTVTPNATQLQNRVNVKSVQRQQIETH